MQKHIDRQKFPKKYVPYLSKYKLLKPINVNEKFSKFIKQWHPHQIAVVDDMQVLLAKLQGEFVWHDHPEIDEVFFVINGVLDIEFRDGKVTLESGEMFVIPKGVEHRPVAKNECKMMIKSSNHLGIFPTSRCDVSQWRVPLKTALRL